MNALTPQCREAYRYLKVCAVEQQAALVVPAISQVFLSQSTTVEKVQDSDDEDSHTTTTTDTLLQDGFERFKHYNEAIFKLEVQHGGESEITFYKKLSMVRDKMEQCKRHIKEIPDVMSF